MLTGQEFRTLLDVSEREGVVETVERKTIDNLIDFSEMTVKDIMIPRPDMFCFSVDDTFEELIRKCTTELYARTVYEETVDHIVGIVYVKDILPFIHQPHHDFHLKRFSGVFRQLSGGGAVDLELGPAQLQ